MHVKMRFFSEDQIKGKKKREKETVSCLILEVPCLEKNYPMKIYKFNFSLTL